MIKVTNICDMSRMFSLVYWEYDRSSRSSNYYGEKMRSLRFILLPGTTYVVTDEPSNVRIKLRVLEMGKWITCPDGFLRDS